MLVAIHPWDCAGAKAVSWWILRMCLACCCAACLCEMLHGVDTSWGLCRSSRGKLVERHYKLFLHPVLLLVIVDMGSPAACDNPCVIGNAHALLQRGLYISCSVWRHQKGTTCALPVPVLQLLTSSFSLCSLPMCSLPAGWSKSSIHQPQ